MQKRIIVFVSTVEFDRNEYAELKSGDVLELVWNNLHGKWCDINHSCPEGRFYTAAFIMVKTKPYTREYWVRRFKEFMDTHKSLENFRRKTGVPHVV